MDTTQQLPAVIERHTAAARAGKRTGAGALYPPDGRVYDRAGARPIAGRAAIRELFAGVLTEPRDAEISTIAVSGHLVAVHLRATLTGPTRSSPASPSTADESLTQDITGKGAGPLPASPIVGRIAGRERPTRALAHDRVIVHPA